MSGSNQFLPFATGGSANTLTPAAYAALTAVIANGFQPGLASSQQANTVWRQATFVAAAVAQIIANQGVNANDDGNLTNFVTNLQTAIGNLGSLQASSIATLTSNTTLTAAQVGGTILGNSTSTITATLPAANSVVAGKQIEFRNINTGTFNILRAGTDSINVNSGSTTSQVLGQGDYLMLESNGSNGWTALTGTVLLSVAAAVTSLLAPYAPLVSPGFTGSPTAPTPASNDSSTKLATTAFVQAVLASVKGLGFGGTTWNDVSGSRSAGTVFTNSYSYPIMVSIVNLAAAYSGTDLYVNGRLVSRFTVGTNGPQSRATNQAIVPPGGTYSVGSFTSWFELY